MVKPDTPKQLVLLEDGEEVTPGIEIVDVGARIYIEVIQRDEHVFGVANHADDLDIGRVHLVSEEGSRQVCFEESRVRLLTDGIQWAAFCQHVFHEADSDAMWRLPGGVNIGAIMDEP